MLKFPLWTFLVLISISFSLRASTDLRHWELPKGKKINASFISFDEITGSVNFRTASGRNHKVQFKSLNSLDQLYIKKEVKVKKDLALLLKRVQGNVEYWESGGKLGTDFYVYLPSIYKTDKNRPLIYLFSSSGRGGNYLKLHIEAAESVGMILVCSDHFQNGSNNSISLKKFRELLVKVRRDLPHDKNAVYLGGDSGGALRAYWYSYQVKGPWQGVYANAGWLQGNHTAPYIGGMRIAMVNGNKDKYANLEIPKDKSTLEKAGNDIRLFIFPGVHQMASVASQKRAFKWLLERKHNYSTMKQDLKTMRQTTIIDQKKYSSIKAIDAADRLHRYLELTGKNRAEVLKVLGKPQSLNDFSLDDNQQAPNAPLTYAFRGFREGLLWTIEFSNGKVSQQHMDNLAIQ